MSARSGFTRRKVAVALGLILVLAAAPPGFGTAPPPDPDPDALSRLRAAAAPGGETLLVGMPVEVGMENPERVFLPVFLFDMGEGRAVTVREISVAGPDGSVLATARPGMRLQSVADVAGTRADVLSRIADRNQERAAGLLRRGLAAFEEGVPVSGLALANGTTTTFTVNATLDAGGTETAVALPLEVTIAALPTWASWHGGDGHVHSQWSDGLFSMSSLVSSARNDGQRFIIMTDHWSGIWREGGLGNANWARYYDACTATQTAHGIPVLPGVELATAGGRGHALGYALTRSAVPPRDVFSTPQALITNINNQNPGTSYAVIAHPFGGGLGLAESWGDWTATGFRAIELMSDEPFASSAKISRWFSLLRAGIPGRVAGGRFVVGTAGTDVHLFNNPGRVGMMWVRSTTSPLTRAAVWNAIRAGQVSASGQRDLGFFTLNGTQQGGLVVAHSTTTLLFHITQRPVTGRECIEISIRDRNNAVVWSVSNPTSTTYARSIAAPSTDNFYVVRMVFRSITHPHHLSEVWCNPIFVDRR